MIILFFSHCLNGAVLQHRTKLTKNKSQNLVKEEITFEGLKFLYKTKWKSKDGYEKLSKMSLTLGKDAVPLLLDVMKRSSYPDGNRWIAIFSLTRITGEKSAPVHRKFLKHPNWLMRLGALRCLNILKDQLAQSEYERLLKDPSILVRKQALLNIDQLKLASSSSKIVLMLKDSTNYIQTKNGFSLPTDLIDQVILSLGNLKHRDVRHEFIKMMQNEQNKKLSYALDYSLEKITGLKSPQGDWKQKKQFWGSQTL